MPSLTPQGCAARRLRLVDCLLRKNLEMAVISDPRDVYYFSGALPLLDLPVALIVRAEGRAILIAPEGLEADGLDRVAGFSWNERGTRHDDIVERMVAEFAHALPRSGMSRVGVQLRALNARLANELTASGARLTPIDVELADMQQCKDADEIEIMRESARANLGAYAAVRQTIRLGVTELDVLAAGIRGAIATAGEKVFHDGDYQCGQYNGPARNRRIEQGELYIVDAWTCYRGYWSDMSRTYFVGNSPSDVQQQLFDHLAWVHYQVPQLLRPGADGRDVFAALDEMIRQFPPLADVGLVHHGGHAIGLRAHEMPDCNPTRGGVLRAGNVICIEPGGYLAEAQYGVRLENMYLITERSCEDLTPERLELVSCA